MMQESEYVEMTRKQLYDEIWELSVSGVADKYHLVYTKLIVTCKRLGIGQKRTWEKMYRMR